MQPKICFCLFLVCLTAAQAVPAGKIEQKSVANQPARAMKDIQLEEIGDDKDRLKKAASFCVDIRPGAENEQKCTQDKSQLQVQTYNFQPASQPVQALSVVQGPPQPAYFVSQPVIPQQVVSQMMPSSVVQPQVVPSVQTLQIIQPSQPCPCSQQAVVEVEKSEPIPVTTPEPTPAPQVVTTPKPVPEKIEMPRSEVVEITKFVPVPPVCKDKLVVVPSKPMVVVPEPTLVKIPHCQHQSQDLMSQRSIGSMRSAAVGPMDHMHLVAIRKGINTPYAKLFDRTMKM